MQPTSTGARATLLPPPRAATAGWRRGLAALAAGLVLLGGGIGLTTPANAQAQAPAPNASPPIDNTVALKLPDVTVRDQNGQPRRFYRDLVAGKTVAVNFIFTSCTSICSPLSATFKAMQTELARQAATAGVQLISISVDPLTDTPEELNRYARKVDAGPGWTFVTGTRASIDSLLKAFGVSAGDPNEHSPMIFLGHDPSRRWVRTYGLANPRQLADRLAQLGQPVATPAAAGQGAARPGVTAVPAVTAVATTSAAAAGTSIAGPAADALAPLRQAATQQAAQSAVAKAGPGAQGAEYFTNLPLVTQDRPRVRFYDDLIRNRVVLITSFYASCKDVCSPVTHNLAKAQEQLQDGVDSPVQLISITTDTGFDSAEVLRDYAARHGARPGWSFVTGKKENVDWVLHKLGLYNEKPEQHTAVLWVGNDRTGKWLKLHALAPPDAIVSAVRKVL